MNTTTRTTVLQALQYLARVRHPSFCPQDDQLNHEAQAAIDQLNSDNVDPITTFLKRVWTGNYCNHPHDVVSCPVQRRALYTISDIAHESVSPDIDDPDYQN
jgi:hypothetical protein